MLVYKQKTINKVIPPATFNYDKLVSLGKLLEELHEECTKELIKLLKEGSFIPPESFDVTNEEEIKKFCDKFKLLYEIQSKSGAYVNFSSLNDIVTHDIPSDISRITISNLSLYKYLTNLYPPIYFELVLDLTEIKIFDLSSSPSNGTPNDSYYHVASMNHTIADGMAERIRSELEKNKNLFPVIHKSGLYDLSLYLFVIPATTAIIYTLKERVPVFITELPVFLQVLSVISGFFLLLLSYRLIYNLGRWLLPYMEIKEQQNKIQTLLRLLYFTLVTGVVTSVCYNFFSSLLSFLK
ncbi:MAG: hypothetical protein VX341_13725 [Bdellovibrionota bacterium]|nr:hypothetical protein [Bdellovibrionota bacterium]